MLSLLVTPATGAKSAITFKTVQTPPLQGPIAVVASLDNGKVSRCYCQNLQRFLVS